jgi:ABC-type multidrug transport system ATPase subunit
VISTFRELAEKEQKTICMTIHQPSSQIFELFDQLMLLCNGQIVYFGRADRAVQYFTDLGYPCPQHTNPADYFIKLIHVEQGNEVSKNRVDQFIQAYQNSELRRVQESVPMENVPVVGGKKRREYAQGWWYQMLLIAQRNFRDIIRTPAK